jgi:hydrogenase maturation protease
MNTKTLVLGLGNLVHTDDGVGIHAVEALRGDARIPPEVELLDGGTQGLGLLHHISGIRRLLVIDAIDVGEPAGTLLQFEGRALRGLPGKASVHQLGFSDLMIALQLLDDSPEEVIVLGIQPGSTEWGGGIVSSRGFGTACARGADHKTSRSLGEYRTKANPIRAHPGFCLRI